MGGDSAPIGTQESMDEILKAFTSHLPGLASATAQATPTIAGGELKAAQDTAEPYARLQQLLYSTYGPQLAQTGAGIDRDLLTGAGGDVARNAQTLDKELNPEYYGTRATASKGIGDLIGGMDPNKLSGSESAEIERGLNRTNPAGTPSPIKAIESGMTFGEGLNKKRQAFEQALGLAVGAIPQFAGKSDTFAQATGRGGTASQSNFLGVNQNAGASGTGFGTNALNNVTGLESQRALLNSQRRDPLDRATQVLGSMPSIS